METRVQSIENQTLSSSMKDPILDDNLPDNDQGNASGYESEVSVKSHEEKSQIFVNGLIKLNEGDGWHRFLKNKFLERLNCFGLDSKVEAIHRDVYSGFRKKAKFQAFSVLAEAMTDKFGKGNVKYAWYGASREEINKITSFGFGCLPRDGIYGSGVYLSPADYPLDSLQSSVAGEDGLRHLLLCRVILGKVEQIRPGSRQSHPSCEDFDTGVDNLVSPRNYIVWNVHMNTHILPEFVISFRSPTSLTGRQRSPVPVKKPNSPWMPFPVLISELSKILSADSVNLIKKHHRDNRERKISRHQLIQCVRQIAGDTLLARIVKSYRAKACQVSTNPLPNKRGNCACLRKMSVTG